MHRKHFPHHGSLECRSVHSFTLNSMLHILQLHIATSVVRNKPSAHKNRRRRRSSSAGSPRWLTATVSGQKPIIQAPSKAPGFPKLHTSPISKDAGRFDKQLPSQALREADSSSSSCTTTPPSSEGTRSAVVHRLNGGEIKSGAILCAWAPQCLAVLPGKCFWISLQMSNRGNEITGRNVFN